MTRSINPVPQFLDAAGNPLAGGRVYYFDSGTNDQKKHIFGYGADCY